MTIPLSVSSTFCFSNCIASNFPFNVVISDRSRSRCFIVQLSASFKSVFFSLSDVTSLLARCLSFNKTSQFVDSFVNSNSVLGCSAKTTEFFLCFNYVKMVESVCEITFLISPQPNVIVVIIFRAHQLKIWFGSHLIGFGMLFFNRPMTHHHVLLD